jgi:prepilin-type N-terminal cleavage/methylation domain-containing protein
MTSGMRQSAFTLVELVIVVALLGILAMLVGPIVASGDGFAAAAAARAISSDIQYAQNHAIAFQEEVTVTFQPHEDTYTLSNESGPLIHPISNEAYVVDLGNQSDYAEFELLTASFGGGQTVTFDELGSPDNDGTVEFRIGSIRYAIDVAYVTGDTEIRPLDP